MHVRVILPFALVAAARLTAQARLGVGAVGGAVQDESGALMTGAKVTLTEESKSLVRESAVIEWHRSLRIKVFEFPDPI